MSEGYRDIDGQRDRRGTSSVVAVLGAPGRAVTGAGAGLATLVHERRWSELALILVVVLPIAFNAVVLWHEAVSVTPGVNDNMFHYLMIRSASDAIAEGANPLDSWGPEMDLGAPRFLHYQNLAALFVIGIDTVTLGLIGLAPIFNATRYLLMVLMPVTVYWAMRRMEFSRPASAGAAAASSLFSTNGLYGIEYDSYIWRGWGMYTQQWAIHLSLILMASLWRLGRTGRGLTTVVVLASILVVSHLLYAEMMVVTAAVVVAFSVDRSAWRSRLAQFAIAGALVAVITCFLWFTYLQYHAYIGESPYDAQWKLDSFGARTILGWLFSGELFDYRRLPVITVTLGIGVAAAIWARGRLHLFALTLFAVWLVLYFGRSVWGPFADYIPSGSMLLFHRFIGSFHIASLLLIGLGFEAVWRACQRLPRPGAAAATVGACALLLVPAMVEREEYYAPNALWMESARLVYDEDVEVDAVIDTFRSLPPGRIHAGLRSNWGEEFGIPQVPWYRVLVFEGFPVVSAPLPSINLHSDLMFHFDDQNPVFYDVFDVRYVLAPSDRPMPEFLTRIWESPRFAIYQAPTSGAATFATSTVRQSAETKFELFFANRDWLLGAAPGAREFIRWSYPAASSSALSSGATPHCADGQIMGEQVRRERLAFDVSCDTASVLVIKQTYHPHWQVTVDGMPVSAFMASPSYIGVDVPPGRHIVVAEYRSAPWRNALAATGFATLVGLFIARRYIDLLR